MLSQFLNIKTIVTLLLIWAAPVSTLFAESAQEKFYRAYYLESQGDFSTASGLYNEVVNERGADRQLVEKARSRLSACREEEASCDFARLMPVDTLAYVELKRPGDQILKLLEKICLLAGDVPASKDDGQGGRRIAISPSLVKEVLGIGGAAVAITGFDMQKEAPSGVLVFHPGNLEVIRGILETGLPAAANAAKPIGGYPAYDIEGQAIVVLTSRLVVAGNDRASIENVLKRIDSNDGASLGTKPAYIEAMKNRPESLLSFYVDGKQIMPHLMKLAEADQADASEMAMVQTLLDPHSLQSVTGSLGVNDAGLHLEIAVRLDSGHHNLIYNLLRTPPINQETMKCIPQGAAGFVVGALNEASSRYSSQGSAKSGDMPVITALDFGRELFANITSVALFALPPEGEAKPDGLPIPDAAAVMTVVDPSKSQALWTQMLGIASLATGGKGAEGESVQIENTEVKTFKFPEGITVYFAAAGNDVLISPSKSAITRSIRAKRAGKTVLDDPAFAKNLAGLGADTTKAVVIHPARCARIARQFMSEGEAREMDQVVGLLTDTTASLLVDHSGEALRVSLNVTGLPNISPMVTAMLNQSASDHRAYAELNRAIEEKDWQKATKVADTTLNQSPDNLDVLRTKFEVLATGSNDVPAATACAEKLIERISDDATALNNFAWILLTEDKYEGRFTDIALRCSMRSNELSKHESWMFLDTLALAKFQSGKAAEAAELQKKAIAIAERSRVKSGTIGELKAALARFEGAPAKDKLANQGTGTP